MSHLVHVAAPPLRAGSVIRQRCAWCGALLDEIDMERVAVADATAEEATAMFVDEDGTPKGRYIGLVAVEQHGEGAAVGVVAKWAVPDPEDGKMPADSCMALDDAVTT